MKKAEGIIQKWVVGLFLFIFVSSAAQEVKLDRVEPPNWWTGFSNKSLQLMVHGTNIGLTTPVIRHNGIVIVKTHSVPNPNYLFLDLRISESAKPGIFTILFRQGEKTVLEFPYRLEERKPGSAERTSFSSADVIYLLMPDRFANGDPANDNITGMKEQCDRSNPDARHGGDIKGITDHTDYLKDLGITAVWSTPLLENDMEKYSYHGYAITDFYRTDPRFGTNEDYLALATKLHREGLKIIMDMVFNHCGLGHWWMKDLPTEDWVSRFPEFTRTNYRVGTVTDPYHSAFDSITFQTGWFDNSMPDLNQNNPFIEKYFIQNAIWWIEYAGLDGIRLDTYPYSFKNFMADWDKAILSEYQNFNIVGECWSTTPDGIAYWQKDARNSDGYNSHLPSVFDFALYDGLRLGFSEKDGWNTGLTRLYGTLAQDFVYPDPSNILVFADNHDVNRYLSTQGNEVEKLKMAMAFILTTRGIPQIYYGTEALVTQGEGHGDGMKRLDFPGGWTSDTISTFTGKGLSNEQRDMQEYMKRLLNWRKNKEVIHTGKLKHFIPKDGIYVYVRYDRYDTVMVVINNNGEEKTLQGSRYAEFLANFSKATDIITGKAIDDLSEISVPPKMALILELKK